MWYFDGRKYRPELYTEEVDQILSGNWGGQAAQEDSGFLTSRSLQAARVHGNPLYDSGDITWNASVQVKRDLDEAVVFDESSGDAVSAEYVDAVTPATLYVDGSYYIVDTDDPDLLEGEEHLHERLTSHTADLYANTFDDPSGFQFVHDYLSMHFCKNLAAGIVPGAVVLEPVRQVLGFPYEWVGAPVE